MIVFPTLLYQKGNMDKIGKILTERYGWEVYPLPSPLVKQREPIVKWEQEEIEIPVDGNPEEKQ